MDTCLASEGTPLSDEWDGETVEEDISSETPAPAEKSEARPDQEIVPLGRQARTRRLILAAVRLWELRRGIRE